MDHHGGDQRHHGSRAARERRRLASSSPRKLSVAGSSLSFRPSIHEIAAAWQAMWECRITLGLAFVGFRDLMQSKKLRAWAETSSPTVVFSVPCCLSSDRSAAEETSISPLSPTSTQPSSPTNRTGQVPRWLIQPGRSPKGVLRKSSTSFTPLAYRAVMLVGPGSYSIGMVSSAL